MINQNHIDENETKLNNINENSFEDSDSETEFRSESEFISDSEIERNYKFDIISTSDEAIKLITKLKNEVNSERKILDETAIRNRTKAEQLIKEAKAKAAKIIEDAEQCIKNAEMKSAKLIKDSETKAADIIKKANVYKVEKHNIIDTEMKILDARKEKVKKYVSNLPSRIKLSIRGENLEVMTNTLRKYEGSMFYDLLSDESEIMDTSQPIFLDRSPESFHVILNFLAGYSIPDWSDPYWKRIKHLVVEDVKFFGLEEVFKTRKNFIESKIFDGKGILYYLGKINNEDEDYVNPINNNMVSVNTNSIKDDYYKKSLIHYNSNNDYEFYIDDKSHWFSIDFGEKRAVEVKALSIFKINYNNNKINGKNLYNLMNFEGSCDNKTWTKINFQTIHYINNDQGIFLSENNNTKEFRHFRIMLLNQKDNNHYHSIKIAGLELYGELIERI